MDPCSVKKPVSYSRGCFSVQRPGNLTKIPILTWFILSLSKVFLFHRHFALVTVLLHQWRLIFIRIWGGGCLFLISTVNFCYLFWRDVYVTFSTSHTHVELRRSLSWNWSKFHSIDLHTKYRKIVNGIFLPYQDEWEDEFSSQTAFGKHKKNIKI